MNTSSTVEQSHALTIATGASLLLAAGFLWGLRQPPSPAGASLPRTINPNHASFGSLVRLPGIGPARAEAIVALRQAHLGRHPGTHAFRQASDLQRIPGIGPKTVEGLCPWLTFDDNCCPPRAE